MASKINSNLKYVILIIGTLLISVTLHSIVTETLLPLYRNGQYDELKYNLIGIPILLLGTGILIYGTWIFLTNTSDLFENKSETIFQNVETIKNKTANKKDVWTARINNTKILFSAWKKGLLILFLGALVFICGGVIINLDKIL